MQHHTISAIDFKDPDYYRNLFISACEDETKAGEKFASYCEGAHKHNLSLDEISNVLLQTGKFKTVATARQNARKIKLLGGSIQNAGLLEDLRSGKISFQKALWEVKDPKKSKKVVRGIHFQTVTGSGVHKKTEKAILNEAISLVVDGLYRYWAAKPKDSVATIAWVTGLINKYIGK